MKKTFCLILITVAITSCSTMTYVKLPEGSVLKLNNRNDKVYKEGKVVHSPFFWSATAGIPYKVEKDGAVIQEGKLGAGFRAVSIFWPPYAIIYWPMGFREKCYDLTKGTVSPCSVDDFKQLKVKVK